MKVETVRLEDNQEYVVLDTIELNQEKYIYLSSIENEKDFCVRKLSFNEEEILGLQSEEELNMALLAFREKHQEN